MFPYAACITRLGRFFLASLDFPYILLHQTLMTDFLLSILRCPVTRQPLRLLTVEEKAPRGIPADEPALITVDGAYVYRAVNGMPVLLPPAKVDEVVSVG